MFHEIIPKKKRPQHVKANHLMVSDKESGRPLRTAVVPAEGSRSLPKAYCSPFQRLPAMSAWVQKK